MGLKYLVVPDWASLAEPKTWIYALGQAFFSLSLAGIWDDSLWKLSKKRCRYYI